MGKRNRKRAHIEVDASISNNPISFSFSITSNSGVAPQSPTAKKGRRKEEAKLRAEEEALKARKGGLKAEKKKAREALKP